MKHKKIITKEMVKERLCLLIESLEKDYDLAVIESQSHKKRVVFVFNLLQKLMTNKLPPALIYAQMKKEFAQYKRTGKAPQALKKEISLRISNPINLN